MSSRCLSRGERVDDADVGNTEMLSVRRDRCRKERQESVRGETGWRFLEPRKRG
jgi:hypothetical protein